MENNCKIENFNGLGKRSPIMAFIMTVATLSMAGIPILAGFFGMKAATYANVRTTQAASTGSKSKALLVALDGGAVMGLSVAGLGLIGLGALFYVYHKLAAHQLNL